MMNTFLLKKGPHSLHLLILSLCLLFMASTLQAQVDDKFLLTESDMPDYQLKNQYSFVWEIAAQKYLEIIRQTWIAKPGDDTRMIVIEYCAFQNGAEAISGTAFAAGTFAIASIWGSIYHTIIADASWSAATGEGMYFVRGNIGINVFIPPLISEERKEMARTFAMAAFAKIEVHLSSEIRGQEARLKPQQLPPAQYDRITEIAVQSALMQPYSPLTVWDSKWRCRADSLTMGIRREWKNDSGAVIGIDICRFDTEELAAAGAKLQAAISYSHVFELDDLDSLKNILGQWQEKWKNAFESKNFSVVGVKQMYAIHFYQYDPAGIATDTVFALLPMLGEGLSNF